MQIMVKTLVHCIWPWYGKLQPGVIKNNAEPENHLPIIESP